MERMKKKKSRIGRKIILSILCGIAAILLIMTVVNLICNHFEQDRIADYGTKVDVFGETINVGVWGSGENVIVILPGSADPSPVLDFRPLAELLSGSCTVVVPEPFGYGLSDITDRERSFDNIADEIHECLSQLGYSSYTLMGHSLSGLTMLQYANLYPGEVEAVVALDTSVPKQSDARLIEAVNQVLSPCMGFLRAAGMYRLLSIFSDNEALQEFWGFGPISDEEADILRHVVCSSMYNRNVREEIRNCHAESARMYEMQYPDEIPVLTFLSADNAEMLPEWTLWHEALTENGHSELFVVSGGHYVYRGHTEEIAAKTLDFIGR